MADWDYGFRFFQGIDVTSDIRIDISISIRSMITKFGKKVDLQDLTQMSLMRQVMVTPLRQDHVTN